MPIFRTRRIGSNPYAKNSKKNTQRKRQNCWPCWPSGVLRFAQVSRLGTSIKRPRLTVCCGPVDLTRVLQAKEAWVRMHT